MKKLFVSCFLLLAGINCHAVFDLVTKAKMNNELNLLKLGQANINTNLQNEMGVMKNNQLKFEMRIGQINNELSAKIVGLDKSISTELKAGRDAFNNSGNTNDTTLMMYIIKGLCGLCTLLIGIISLTVKSMFKQMDSARYYQMNVAKLSKNGEFDEIMRQKKELEKQKSILSKSIGLIKQGKELMSKKEGV